MGPLIACRQVIDEVAGASQEFALLLGAGTSISSGIPGAGQMIAEWQQLGWDYWRSETGGDLSLESWLAQTEQDWMRAEGGDHLYSELFCRYFPSERSRQEYIERKVEAAFPSWGYFYLANILHSGRMKVVFTTNFDDLISKAMILFLGCTAVECSAESQVETINLLTPRPKIIKLHGDYRYPELRNSREELQALGQEMGEKFHEICRQQSLVVLGYSGGDLSVMGALDSLLASRDALPRHVYWGVHPSDTHPSPLLVDLQKRHPGRILRFGCRDFDGFMADLHQAMGLEQPPVLVDPITAAQANLRRLIAGTSEGHRQHPGIAAEVRHLERELNAPLGTVKDRAGLELFSAQVLLAGRDAGEALRRIEQVALDRKDDAPTLTLWGQALQIQAEETGERERLEQAIEKWKQAILVDPDWVPARMALLRIYSQQRRLREAIEQAGILHRLQPRDAMTQRQLAWLLQSVGQTHEALRLVDDLLKREPDQVDLLLFRAAVLEQLGQLSEAVHCLEEAARREPDNGQAQFQLAAGYVKLVQPDRADAAFQRAIALDPDNTLFLIQAAAFLTGIRQAQRAVPLLERAVEAEPLSAEAWGYLADVKALLGQFAEALEDAHRAIALNPGDARLHGTAGRILAGMNRLAEAEQELTLAISISPDYLNAYTVLGQLYAGTGRVAELDQLLQKLWWRDPGATQMLGSQLMPQARANAQAAGRGNSFPGWGNAGETPMPWPPPLAEDG